MFWATRTETAELKGKVEQMDKRIDNMEREYRWGRGILITLAIAIIGLGIKIAFWGIPE